MTQINPRTSKPYSKGSQPYVIHRWLDGDPKPGVCRPSRNNPYLGVMMLPDTKTLECRNGQLFAYGEKVARRGGDRDSIEVMMALSNYASATIARHVAREALRRGFRVAHIGPDGTLEQAAEMRMACVERMMRGMRRKEEWSVSWRLHYLANEVKLVAETGLVDPERLGQMVLKLKAAVTKGRMGGWAENRCQATLQEIETAQRAIVRLEEAA